MVPLLPQPPRRTAHAPARRLLAVGTGLANHPLCPTPPARPIPKEIVQWWGGGVQWLWSRSLTHFNALHAIHIRNLASEVEV
jgi:hypothetical protein